MKKLSKTAPKHCHWLATVALVLFSCALALGQGFYQEYPDLFNGVRSAERIVCLSNGNYVLPIDDRCCEVAWLEADAQGAQIQAKTTPVSIPGNNFPFNYVVTNDGNYVELDTSFNPGTPTQHFLKLTWYNFNHTVLQTQVYTIDPLRGYAAIGRIISDDAGNFYVAGLFTNSNNDFMLYAIKFDAAGNILWQAPLTTGAPDGWTRINGLSLGKDGSLLVEYSITFSATQHFIIRKDINTGQEWSISGMSLPPINNWDIVMAGDNNHGTLYYNYNSKNLIFTNATQTNTWSKNINTLLNTTSSLQPLFLMSVSGGWVGMVNFYQDPSNQRVIMFKIDAAGNLLWQKDLSLFLRLNRCSAGKELPDGSMLFAGNYVENPFLLKVSPEGNIFPNQIIGQMANDLNANCLIDNGDGAIQNSIVQAVRQSDGVIFYGETDATGHYVINDVDTGTYVVRPDLFFNSTQWQMCGTLDTVQLPLANQPGTAVANFEFQAINECTFLWAYAGTDRMKVCNQSIFVVHYCNTGTQMATGAYINVNLPEAFTIDSASAPYTLIAPNTLHFEVGTVPIGFCNNIFFWATLDCDPALTGQTLCVSTTVFPDTMCGPSPSPWSGATISLEGHCDADSVRFDILNIGSGNTSQTLDFVIVEDHVISLQGQFDLAGGASKTIALPKDGATWRIQAEQEPTFPANTEPVSIALEGCVQNGSPFTTGMVNLFPNNIPWGSISCYPVLNSFDPNIKEGYPIGVDDAHYIDQNISIDYQINFQNTGSSEAQTVILKDSLSQWLNPLTLRMGPASHPYTWTLSGNGVLEVRFADINLPDSASNEAASHGFVRFNIAQQKDNPVGTVINNKAGIYFDANPAVITNVVKHTIGKNFLDVKDVNSPSGAAIKVTVEPNPVDQTAQIAFDQPGAEFQTFDLYDVAGKLVQSYNFSGNHLEFKREHLPAGMYLFDIRSRNGTRIGAGKMLLK